MSNLTRIAKNLCLRNGMVYGKARAGGRNVWKRSPWQGSAALGRANKPTAALLKWRDEWMGDLRTAADRARKDPDAEPAGRIPSWQELIDAYKVVAPRQFATAGSPAPETVHNNVVRLERLLSDIGVARTEPLTAATPQKIEDWVHGIVQHAADDHGARYLAARTLSQARSVWSRWTLEPYRRRGFVVPRALERWPRPSGYAPIYQDPPEELKASTRTGASELETTDPAIWLAFALMRYCGMRPGDAQRARWEWIRKQETGARLLFTPHKTRQATRGRMVDQNLSADFWRRLLAARQACGDTDGFILPGGETGRQRAIDRVNEHMRLWGWQTAKASYELRKLFVSEIYNWKGIVWAASYSGDNPTTIERYYAAAYRKDAPALDIGEMLRLR